MIKNDFAASAQKFINVHLIDRILILSPLRVGLPHRIAGSLAIYSTHFVIFFFIHSLALGLLKIIRILFNLSTRKSLDIDSLNGVVFLEVLTDNVSSFYRERPDVFHRFLNVARCRSNKSEVLCPLDLLVFKDGLKALFSTIKSLYSEILVSYNIKKDVGVLNRLDFIMIIAWKIRHIQDIFAAKCIERSKVKFGIYVDWFENQVIDVTIAGALAKRNVNVYYVSDYLVDVRWHLNLNPEFWHISSRERHFGAIIEKNIGNEFMSWWSTRLFRNKVLHHTDETIKRVVFVYPFQFDLAKQVARIQHDFTKMKSRCDIVVKRHPNSNYKVESGEEATFFYKNDTIVSLQTSLITELYYQGVSDIAVLQLEDYVETGLPEGSYRIIKTAKEIVK